MSFESIVNIGDKIQIDLIGELDIYSASEFMDETQNLIFQHKKDLVLDFSQLDYLDSSGLGVLISILNEAKKENKKVYIKGVKPRIRKLFTITKIEELFEFIG